MTLLLSLRAVPRRESVSGRRRKAVCSVRRRGGPAEHDRVADPRSGARPTEFARTQHLDHPRQRSMARCGWGRRLGLEGVQEQIGATLRRYRPWAWIRQDQATSSQPWQASSAGTPWYSQQSLGAARCDGGAWCMTSSRSASLGWGPCASGAAVSANRAAQRYVGCKDRD